MITKETFKYFIETIDPETMQTELGRASDFILFQAHYFNVGSFATIDSMDYDYEVEQEANASGNLFCDKDEFLRLCDELEIFEY
jgi:hypothetical protein